VGLQGAIAVGRPVSRLSYAHSKSLPHWACRIGYEEVIQHEMTDIDLGDSNVDFH
jgi:hypothetical protein